LAEVKILQIAPPWEAVPPPAYGGTEAVVHLLTEGLVAAGHDVTLVASGESKTAARHVAVHPAPLRSEEDIEDRRPFELVHVAEALKEAGDGYDVIHNHAGDVAVALSGLVNAPMVTTLHGLIPPDWQEAWKRYTGYYTTVSENLYSCLLEQTQGTYLGHVYNAIDVESYPFSAEKDDEVLFLSRICEEKAPHLAIEAARRAGLGIVVAGKVDPNPDDEKYFAEVIEPLLADPGVTWFGEADAAQKRELFRRARAVLFPIQWEEPFGLVPVEAMACGTPTIAFRRGAMPEVIEDGVSGFLVDDLNGMVHALERISELSPSACRSYAAERFDAPIMIRAYESVYRRLLDTEARRLAEMADQAVRSSVTALKTEVHRTAADS
jgi:glycosyltransferase involved in cell wall biosynthesis